MTGHLVTRFDGQDWLRADHLVTGKPLGGPPDHNVVAWCLAHRQQVRWAPAPMWWFHTGSSRTCPRMYDTYAPRELP